MTLERGVHQKIQEQIRIVTKQWESVRVEDSLRQPSGKLPHTSPTPQGLGFRVF